MKSCCLDIVGRLKFTIRCILCLVLLRLILRNGYPIQYELMRFLIYQDD